MTLKYKVGPHYRQKLSTKTIMWQLTLALLVVYAFGLWKALALGQAYFLNALILLVVSLSVALLTEALYAFFTKQQVKNYLLTSFGWVTAIILTLMVPVNTEPYALGVATFIAIFFGKLVFGGFGQNIFNPAAVGRAVIFASFAGSISADLVTTATPTQTMAAAGWLLDSANFSTFLADFGGIGNLFFGTYNGAIGETSTLLILLLAVYLAYKEVIDYRVPLVYLGTIFISALFIGLTHGLGLNYALFHVFTGGAAFGAVFMLTDPVTNPNTRVGRMIFALAAAFFTMLIRLCANLPEGVLYSILLANILTPLIDKIFDGKQVLLEKRNLRILSIAAVAVLLTCSALGFTLNNDHKYKSFKVPSGETVLLNADLSQAKAKLVSQDGDKYLIKASGFSALEDGGQKDIIEVTVSDGKITALKFAEYNDTPGVGDVCLEDLFLNQFIDATLESEINCVSGATMTSKAAIAAAQLALKGGYPYDKGETVKLNADYDSFKAVVNKNADGCYHVTVKGFGLMNGEAGYSRNEFDISIADGKITAVNFVTYGDTQGVGDACMSPDYLDHFIGKGLTDDVDLLAGCTWTAKSTVAALNAALQAAGE